MTRALKSLTLWDVIYSSLCSWPMWRAGSQVTPGQAAEAGRARPVNTKHSDQSRNSKGSSHSAALTWNVRWKKIFSSFIKLSEWITIRVKVTAWCFLSIALVFSVLPETECVTGPSGHWPCCLCPLGAPAFQWPPRPAGLGPHSSLPSQRLARALQSPRRRVSDSKEVRSGANVRVEWAPTIPHYLLPPDHPSIFCIVSPVSSSSAYCYIIEHVSSDEIILHF